MDIAGNLQETAASSRKARVLVVPGFVADTYSQIERGLIELCASPDRDLEFLWLVPEIAHKHNRFWRQESRQTLREPAWVPHLRRHGVPYVIGNVSKYGLVSNYLLFREIFRNNEIDAVYTHFGFERFWATFFGKLWGKVTVWHERWHSLGTRYVFPKRLFYRVFVDEFIAISTFITSTLPRGRRVHTIPNATLSDPPIRYDTKDKSAIRQRLAIEKDRNVVLMVANFRAWKRHLLALEICERVLKCRSDVLFVFLGEGEMRPVFLERAKRIGMDRNVIAPGYVDNVDDYYAITQVSMLTSYYEPFGNVLLEAMRHGLPVVAFNTGGPAEVIRDGETGFLAKEGDLDEFAHRLLDLVRDTELRATVGERARQVVQSEHCREIWIERIRRVLREVIVDHRETSS